MITLTSKEYETYLNQTNFHIYKTQFADKWTEKLNKENALYACHLSFIVIITFILIQEKGFTESLLNLLKTNFNNYT